MPDFKSLEPYKSFIILELAYEPQYDFGLSIDESWREICTVDTEEHQNHGGPNGYRRHGQIGETESCELEVERRLLNETTSLKLKWLLLEVMCCVGNSC